MTKKLLSAARQRWPLPRSSPAGGRGDNNSGFHTAVPAMLTPLAPDATVEPIISVGDTVRDYRFESIPDGISFTRNGRGTMDVYVNHETSLVPFPATRSDFTNSLVSKLRLNQHSAGVLRGDYVDRHDRTTSGSARTSSPGRHRASSVSCSSRTRRPATSSCARATRGIRRSSRWTSPPPNRPASSSRSTRRAARIARSTGWAATTTRTTSPCLATAIRSSLSGDDTFDAPASQLYMFSARARDALERFDDGTLYAFVADDPNVNDYGDFPAANGARATSWRFLARSRPASAPTEPTCGPPTSATRLRRPASRTGRNGCSSTGATTSCARSSPSASRTSPTTGTTRTSSTSRTPASRGRSRTAPAGSGEAPRAPAARIRTGASSRWCSTRTTRARC